MTDPHPTVFPPTTRSAELRYERTRDEYTQTIRVDLASGRWGWTAEITAEALTQILDASGWTKTVDTRPEQ